MFSSFLDWVWKNTDLTHIRADQMSGPDKDIREETEEEHEEKHKNAKAPKDAAPPPPPFLPRAENDTSTELVLKVRKQSPRENDFIEIELDRQKLTYQDLLQVSCRELGINLEQVMKIRKLPNTLLRKDKDISRLREFQELELILVNHGMTESTPSLIEKPCYNHNASKMTY
ncbi:putative ANKRD40 C-terminal-like protein [Vombatus ursinus]|uniref:ANKRD40 C-terminal like n=1 Tax=Vombatus ursinus TaxID=29139 RepID=A0A4X2L0U8_VOMUR|nr:putative ANKRD40 C-terminal-like protein [Vombatus ursinus]